MKFQKDKDGDWIFTTENFKLYFTCWNYWWDLALPLRFNIEWFHKDYTEIQLHILSFNISFTKIHNRYSEKLDKLLGDYKNEKD